MKKVQVTGELITKWFTKGETFDKTEIIEGLPVGCHLKDATLINRGQIGFEDAVILELTFSEPQDSELVNVSIKKIYN